MDSHYAYFKGHPIHSIRDSQRQSLAIANKREDELFIKVVKIGGTGEDKVCYEMLNNVKCVLVMDSFDLGRLQETLDEDDSRTLHMHKSKYEGGYMKLENCLVRKVFDNKAVNRDGFIIAIHKACHTINSVDTELFDSDNTFMFRFHDKVDRHRVYVGSSWNFDNQLIVHVKPSGIGELTDHDFTHALFWIQIFKVPLACSTESTAKHIGSTFGNVEGVDLGDLGDCEELIKYMRCEWPELKDDKVDLGELQLQAHPKDHHRSKVKVGSSLNPIGLASTNRSVGALPPPLLDRELIRSASEIESANISKAKKPQVNPM
ncbi:hypothetical protein Scep_004514 [Stephania cephalantha]|uniref:DUF4283 domain-containing protein n=1 Tax=Stephania cephalantha TaxID=152367 RepID=A0AAP0KTI3_9MAGN